ncbi:MAG: hypothetical protein K5746_04340 [Clostridiales bacterium]|nr:hypothetical protein [Clostridiales bacterium]
MQGVKDDYLAAFMMSSILLNPQLLFLGTLKIVPGWKRSLVYLAFAVVFALITGLLIG